MVCFVQHYRLGAGNLTRTIRLCRDEYFIKYVLSIDDSYNSIAYDGPDLDHFIPNGVWFLLLDGSDLAGIINFTAMNNVLWTAHVIIFKLYRGQGTEQWGQQAVEYMKKNLGAKQFLVMTPYKNAKKYAERVGFKYISVLKNSIQKNGELLDQYMLEMD